MNISAQLRPAGSALAGDAVEPIANTSSRPFAICLRLHCWEAPQLRERKTRGRHVQETQHFLLGYSQTRCHKSQPGAWMLQLALPGAFLCRDAVPVLQCLLPPRLLQATPHNSTQARQIPFIILFLFD